MQLTIFSTIKNMVTVRPVKLRNSWYYKKLSNTLRIGTYTKEFLINTKFYNKEWLQICFHLSYMDFGDEDLHH